MYAVYGIVSNKLNKISWQTGLRYEVTDLVTELKTTGERNVRTYNNLFPVPLFTYQMTESKALQVSYSRRIGDPGGRLLNPFTSIADSRNLFTGNPQLQPVFADSYKLGYLINSKNSSIYAGGYYRRSDGLFQRIRLTINGITYARPYNISKRKAYGIETNVSKEVTKWYRISGNANFFYLVTSGGSVTFGEEITSFDEATSTTLSMRLSNNFKFNKPVDFQLNVSYRAPRNTVQDRRFSITSIDMGLSRDVLKGNGPFH